MVDPSQIPYVSAVEAATSPDELDAIPIFGGVWRSINAIIDFIEFGCYPNWQVWVRTLLPAIGEAVLVLISFSIDDIIRGYFRPTGTRGFSGLTRLPIREANRASKEVKEGESIFKIPEFGEEIGSHLPGAKVVKARKVTNTEALLWDIDALAQRGLYYWMIADIVGDFTVNWTSAIMNSQECSEVAYRLEAHAVNSGPYIDDIWEDLVNGWVIDEEIPPGRFASGTITVPPGKTLNVSIEGTVRPTFGPGDRSGQLAVKQSGVPNVPIIASGLPVGPDWSPIHITMVGRVSGATAFTIIEMTTGGVTSHWENVKLSASF
jgi:hypothetical protein